MGIVAAISFFIVARQNKKKEFPARLVYSDSRHQKLLF